MIRMSDTASSTSLKLINCALPRQNATRSSEYPMKSIQCFVVKIASVLCHTISPLKLISMSSVTMRKLNAMIWKIARIQKYAPSWRAIQMSIPRLKEALGSVKSSKSSDCLCLLRLCGEITARRGSLSRSASVCPKTMPLSPLSLSDWPPRDTLRAAGCGFC